MLAWFQENCTGFDREFEMVPMNFADLGLAGAQRRLFKMKLNAVLETKMRLDAAAMEKERHHGS